jgi:hypothetical protein
MTTDMGELLVGAYLKVIWKCDFVDYNVRPPVGGMEGLGELDVVGLNFEDKAAYLCEVATHLGGLEYGKGYADSVDRIRRKFERQRNYAERYLKPYRPIFMFWAPRVPKGPLLDGLQELSLLQLVVNSTYTAHINDLIAEARKVTRDVGNPAFRLLQILARARSL